MSDSGVLRRWEAVVLAAGASTRMGIHKALMAWEGQPLVAHQVKELLATRARRVVVVLGAQAQQIAAELQRHVRQPPAAPWGAEPRVEIVVNSKWREGKSSSIRSGVERVVRGGDRPLAPYGGSTHPGRGPRGAHGRS